MRVHPVGSASIAPRSISASSSGTRRLDARVQPKRGRAAVGSTRRTRVGFIAVAEGTTSEELTKQAIEAAHDAMEQYTETRLHAFAREATRSIEMAAKAALAKISPVLIADPRSIDSQLHLAGHPGARLMGDRRIRTISCREALERVTRLVPTLRVEDLDPLISVRDGSTHFLVSEREALESLVIPYLASLLLLQQRLGLSDDVAFGSYAELVTSLREKHTEEVDRTVAAKVARARHTFEERYGHLDPKALTVVLHSIEAGIVLDKYDQQTAPCPACDSTAVISGQHEFQGWEADDYDDEGFPNGAYPVVKLFVGSLNCPTCGLELDGSDEVAAAGIETVIDVEDVKAEDFYDPPDDY
jgi:hypothetical protein